MTQHWFMKKMSVSLFDSSTLSLSWHDKNFNPLGSDTFWMPAMTCQWKLVEKHIPRNMAPPLGRLFYSAWLQSIIPKYFEKISWNQHHTTQHNVQDFSTTATPPSWKDWLLYLWSHYKNKKPSICYWRITIGIRFTFNEQCHLPE